MFKPTDGRVDVLLVDAGLIDGDPATYQYAQSSLSFSGRTTGLAARTVTSALSFAGTRTHSTARTFTSSLPFSGGLAYTFLKWIQNQLRTRAKNNKVAVLRRGAVVKVVGPQEMVFKRGTSIELEATFTDADGNLYDPDTGSVKLQIRKPDGTVYTGWNFTDNKLMVKISTGVYRIDWQTAVADTVGSYTAEARGAVGAVVSIDDLRIPLKA